MCDRGGVGAGRRGGPGGGRGDGRAACEGASACLGVPRGASGRERRPPQLWAWRPWASPRCNYREKSARRVRPFSREHENRSARG